GESEFAGWGGARMSEAGGTRDWVERAGVMGIWDVLKQYGWFRERFHETLAEIEERRPRVLVLIDYPGFNLRLAKAVRERFPGMKIVQYVCPQVWAWKRSRIPKMAKWLDAVLCLFPFEVEVLAEGGCEGKWVGHPIVDELREKVIEVERDEKLVGLFPGSRRREVERLFPEMLEAARLLRKERPELRFEVPAVSETLERQMRELVAEDDLVTIRVGTSAELMQRAGCGVMASGTATLEAAWFGLPHCLVYRVAPLTWMVGKALVKIDHIGIVNVLAGREVTPEFLQNELSAGVLRDWVLGMLEDPVARGEYGARLRRVTGRLGDGGVHRRVVDEILQLLDF
ncbi:MAG: lipid-A-disaccharide synthase, partial [Verrucomicrobiota bacterium]